MITPINPYVAGNSVGDSPAFIGRLDILREVMQVLGRSHDNAVALYGQRRIGKTSILQQLAVWLPQQGPYRSVYFDLQDKAAKTLDEVLRELAQVISRVFGLPDPDLGTEVAATFRDVWLRAVVNGLPDDSCVVLLFDEFDVLTDLRDDEAGAALFPYLRSLLDCDPARLRFVFVIGRKIDDLSTIALSLFKGIRAVRVSLLAVQETFALTCLSEQNGTLQWPKAACERVQQLTSGHPLLTQQLCSSVWEHAYRDRPTAPPLVQPDDVDAAVPDTLDAIGYALEWLWNGLPPAARVVAAGLAAAGIGPVSLQALDDLLRESGVRVVIPQLQEAPRLLQDWDLIEPAENGFCFRVELLRRWIAEHKPPSRVQSELDRIEPLAEMIYQTAVGLYSAKKLHDAIEQLQQAIRLNPNHLAANQLLADLLVAKDRYHEARDVLERLYEYQPTATLPRLVQTLLALASKAPDDRKQLALYERILEVSPEQIEAATGRQRVWKERGDAALARGDLDAASKAYRQAGLDEQSDEIEGLQQREAEMQAETFSRNNRWEAAATAYDQLISWYPDAKRRLEWESGRDYCRQQETLAKMFAQGIGALQQETWELARQAFAQVVYVNPRYELNGKLAAWLLLRAIWEVPESAARARRIRSDILDALGIGVRVLGWILLAAIPIGGAIAGLSVLSKSIPAWVAPLTALPWWGQIAIGVVSAALLTFVATYLVPWLLVLTVRPPPDGYLLVCRDLRAMGDIRSLHSIGITVRRSKVTIGSHGHVRVAGLQPVEFQVERRGTESVVLSATGHQMFVIQGNPKRASARDSGVFLIFSNDRTKLRC